MNVDLTPLHSLGEGGLPGTELKNGDHTIITCSKCRKKLCDVWLTQPDLDVHTKLIAQCDYCGDRSFEKEVHGKFHLGITDDSGLSDIKTEFIDGPNNATGIYQRWRVFTKRLR